jgi:hypothetical protein
LSLTENWEGRIIFISICSMILISAYSMPEVKQDELHMILD